MRCITFHDRTGGRCPNKISRAKHIRPLGLCRKCYGSFALVLFAVCTSTSDIEFMVRARWTHISELRRLINKKKAATS
jgi:hypothetical protein